MTISSPWLPSSPYHYANQPLRAGRTFPPTTIILQAHWSMESSEIRIDTVPDLFIYEADMVTNHIKPRQTPAMSWDDTLSNLQLLGTWRGQVLVVPEDYPAVNIKRILLLTDEPTLATLFSVFRRGEP